MLAQNLEQIQASAFPKATFNISTSIGDLITNNKILNYVFAAAALALLIYLIIGGLQMMTSRGDPKAMESAKGKITNAVIGFVIVVFAFFITQIIGQLLGLGTFGGIFK